MDYKTAPCRLSKLLGVDMVLDTKGAETQMRWWQDCFGSCRKLPDRLFFLIDIIPNPLYLLVSRCADFVCVDAVSTAG